MCAGLQTCFFMFVQQALSPQSRLPSPRILLVPLSGHAFPRDRVGPILEEGFCDIVVVAGMAPHGHTQQPEKFPESFWAQYLANPGVRTLNRKSIAVMASMRWSLDLLEIF